MALFPASLSADETQAKDRKSWWASLFVLCAFFGALLGFSVKAQNILHNQDLPARNYPALAEDFKILKKRGDDDSRTIAELVRQKQQLESDLPSRTQAAHALADDLKQANFLAGLTGVQGVGLIVTLNDSKKRVPGAPPEVQEALMIHDKDINPVVNELKAAGAEAISINGQRLVATSAIRCAGPTVYINNTPQTPPYVIKAIGDPKTLQDAINLPGGVADTLTNIDPAMIKSERSKHLTLPAYAGATQPRYAKPLSLSEASADSTVKG